MNFDWMNSESSQSRAGSFPNAADEMQSDAISHWDNVEEDNTLEDACIDDVDVWASQELEDNSDEEMDCESDAVTPTAEQIASMMSKLIQSPPTPLPNIQASQPRPPITAESCPGPLVVPSNVAVSVSIESLDPELREAFLDDARSCVSSMEAALLRLEVDPGHAESLKQISRELHTLKGASASVGLVDLADQLHRLEDSLHEDQVASRTPCFDALLKSVDSIRSQIVHGNHPPVVVDRAPASFAQPMPTTASFSDDASDDESVRVKSSQLNRLMDMLAELVMLRNRRETELGELQEVYHELIGSVSRMRLLCNEGSQTVTAGSSLQLSEIANDVLEVAHSVRDCARPVAEGNIAVSQFIRQFRQELVELRRTPVSGLFQRLQRVVRDAAQLESKRVQLKLLGEDAGIERSLQQRLYEPLLHIVRNSVCHGIETSEVRERNGKKPIGTITLEAKSGPDLFVIEVRDDGNGLDYDAIRRRGIETGLLAAGQSASRQELSQLIFHPGFSTRQTANQSAGRGVGMDVVASTLQRMRGWLEIDSEPQQGTRIRLSFPLPSVIQHAMVFRCGDQLFALPMQSVHSIGEATKTETCLDFSEVMGTQQKRATDSFKKIVLACDFAGSTVSGSGLRSVMLLVDDIIGPEEVVVRPLPALLKPHPFFSGATLSGMGKTVIFLDARRLLESRSSLIKDHASLLEPSQVPLQNKRKTDPQAARPRVLVVDDSLSARKRAVRSLRRYPFEIVEASDGKEALELLKTNRFAAVFSDMEMPHINGMELLAEIHTTNRSDSPPVVIISSRNETEFTAQALTLGASSYLIKPLADDALDHALAKMELFAFPQP